MVYFVFAGLLNMVIAFHLPQIFNIDAKTAESYWVDYKTFGSTIINVTFTLFVFMVIMRRHPEALAAFKDVHKAKTAAAQNSATTNNPAEFDANAPIVNNSDAAANNNKERSN